MKKDYSENIKLYLDKLKKTIDILDLEQWNNFINLLEDACETGKQIFIMEMGVLQLRHRIMYVTLIRAFLMVKKKDLK